MTPGRSSGTPLVIDTDPALGVSFEGRPRDVDDAFAIVEALRAPDIDLLGITVTFGNAPLDDALKVTTALLETAAADIPIAAGEARTLPADGLPPRTDAVALLHDILSRRRIRIAALGPLGNLGALLLHHPEDAANIEEVVIVGGRSQGSAFYLGDTGPVRDFNFENDVRAARLLLESGVPVVCAGFELSSTVAMTARHLERISAAGTPLARHLAELSRPWLDYWTRTFPADQGFHPWDSAAICWLRAPELIESEVRGWRIHPTDQVPRGGNPDESAAQVDWLETGRNLPGSGKVVFCTGFVPGGAERFLDNVVAACR